MEYWRTVQLTESNWWGGRTGGVEPVEYWRTVQLTEYNWWGGRTGGVEPVEYWRTSSQLGGVELRAALNVVLAVENAWSRTGGFDPVEYWRTVQLTESI